MLAKTKVLTKGYKQGSANRADSHIYFSFFHTDHHGATHFSKMTINYCTFRNNSLQSGYFRGVCWHKLINYLVFLEFIRLHLKQRIKFSENDIVADNGG